MTNSCDRCRDELPLYAAGTLAADAAARVSKHVAGCAACEAALDEWRLLGQAARLDANAAGARLPPIEPLLERIQLGSSERDDAPGRRVPTSTQRVLVVAAVLAILLLGGALLVRPRLQRAFTTWMGSEPISAPGATSLGEIVAHATASGRDEPSSSGSSGARPTQVAFGPAPIARQPTSTDTGRLAIGSVAATSAAAGDWRQTDLWPAASVAATTAATSVSGADAGENRIAPPTVPHAAPGAPATSPARRTEAPAPATDALPTTTEAPASATAAPPTNSPAPPPTTGVPVTWTLPAATPTVATMTPAEPSVTPDVAPTGVISGRVIGSDGGGRAEMYVRAYAVDRPGDVIPPARTDASGAYRLPVAPGQWLVVAEGAGFQARWFQDTPDPDAADAVEVTAGREVAGIDVRLSANPSGAVTGRISARDGAAVYRAMVVAVRLENPAAPDDAGGIEAVAFSGSDGVYRLSLREGLYALGLRPTWRSPTVRWWDGRDDLANCDLVGVDDGLVTEGVDFTLP